MVIIIATGDGVEELEQQEETHSIVQQQLLVPPGLLHRRDAINRWLTLHLARSKVRQQAICVRRSKAKILTRFLGVTEQARHEQSYLMMTGNFVNDPHSRHERVGGPGRQSNASRDCTSVCLHSRRSLPNIYLSDSHAPATRDISRYVNTPSCVLVPMSIPSRMRVSTHLDTIEFCCFLHLLT